MTIPSVNTNMDHLRIHRNATPLAGRYTNANDEMLALGLADKNLNAAAGRVVDYACIIKAYPSFWTPLDMTGTYVQAPFGTGHAWLTGAKYWDGYAMNLPLGAGYQFTYNGAAPTDIGDGSKYTVELWVYGGVVTGSSLTTSQVLFASAGMVIRRFSQYGGVSFAVTKNANAIGIVQASGPSAPQVNHIVVQYDAAAATNKLRIWVNGTLGNTNPTVPNLAMNMGDFYVGSNTNTHGATELIELRVSPKTRYDSANNIPNMTAVSNRWNG